MKCERCQNNHDGNYGSGRFCSTKCARGFSTKEKRELVNQKVTDFYESKNPKVNRECKCCKSNFITKEKFTKTFCSQSCVAKYHMNLPESKIRLSNFFSKLAYKRHAEGDPNITWKSRVNRKPSYPETVYMKILEELNIDYIREFPVGKYNLDFKIFQNVDLEIDGRTHEEIQVKEKDKIRDEYLRSNGWKVIRIKWESKRNYNHLEEFKKTMAENGLL
jgi:hypothetical protein